MKVVVISDTHMPKKGKRIPTRAIHDLQTADVIIHAGDWKTKEVYEELSQYGDVYGVYGNVDDDDIRQLFGEKKILDVGGFKLGIVHGHGEKKTTERRVVEAFDGEELDCIIFGHSHLPLIRWVNKTLLFNPGSLTDKRKLPFYSYGIMHLNKEITCEHIYFSDKQ